MASYLITAADTCLTLAETWIEDRFCPIEAGATKPIPFIPHAAGCIIWRLLTAVQQLLNKEAEVNAQGEDYDIAAACGVGLRSREGAMT